MYWGKSADINVKDVTWIDANGSEMTPETWDNDLTRCFGMLLDGRAQATGIKRRGSDVTLLVVLNAHHDVVEFTLPRCYDALGWVRLIDTNDPVLAERELEVGHVYEVTGRSLLLFERKGVEANSDADEPSLSDHEAERSAGR